jgi:subtilase family serine protease
MKIPLRFLPCLLLATATVASMPAQSTSTLAAANSTPSFIKLSTDLGAADASQEIDVTLALASRDSAALDKFVNDVRTPGTGPYHQFLTPAEFVQQFGATSESLKAVSEFAGKRGLKVSSIASNHLSATLRGSVASVQKAFGVQIHNFSRNGQLVRSNTSNLVLDSSLATSVTAASASDYFFNPDHVQALDPSGKPLKPVPLSASPQGIFFANGCFRSPETITKSKGGVTATYVGNRYGSDINSGPPNLPSCGYDVADVWGGYNLKPMYSAGLDGTGESIVIVDAYGSTSIKNDANLFSQINGLPALTSTNFKVIGKLTNGNASWAGETTLDVEWAHAIAPNAKIVLEVAPTNSFADLYNAELDAISHHRGVVVSNSWSGFESGTSAGLRGAFDAILKEAIAIGMDVNFSTGDFGDNVILLGYADVGYPASSPYATSIGGTSLALTQSHTMKFQTGWGNNITKLIDGATGDPMDPPEEEGFIFGATGGNSNVYNKPSWQVGTNQPRRATPDISWLADPYTGVEIVQTISGTTYVEVIGGTSLACPMFSAIWAITNQKANTTVGLGDAASMLYNLPSGAVLDVVPFSTADNVHGVIKDSFGTYAVNATELATPLDYTRYFYSALYQGASSHSWYALTFGTDSTLYTKQGWDNVTGVGTPNGLKFVTDIANKK